VGKKSRIILFAGVEKGKKFTIDTNVIHYNEAVIIGSEWIGVDPPNYKLYDLALELIAKGVVPVKELITHRVRFAVEEIKNFEMIRNKKTLKSVIVFD